MIPDWITAKIGESFNPHTPGRFDITLVCMLQVLDVIIQVFKNGGDDFLDIPILPSSIEKPRKFKG